MLKTWAQVNEMVSLEELMERIHRKEQSIVHRAINTVKQARTGWDLLEATKRDNRSSVTIYLNNGKRVVIPAQALKKDGSIKKSYLGIIAKHREMVTA